MRVSSSSACVCCNRDMGSLKGGFNGDDDTIFWIPRACKCNDDDDEMVDKMVRDGGYIREAFDF